MKLASIFFTENESIFMIHHKDTDKRARNNIFVTKFSSHMPQNSHTTKKPMEYHGLYIMLCQFLFTEDGCS